MVEELEPSKQRSLRQSGLEPPPLRTQRFRSRSIQRCGNLQVREKFDVKLLLKTSPLCLLSTGNTVAQCLLFSRHKAEICEDLPGQYRGLQSSLPLSSREIVPRGTCRLGSSLM